MYHITRMSGDPAVQSDELCRLSMISLSNIVAVKFKRNRL